MAVYSREVKIKACKMYFEEHKTTLEICKELNIRNRAQPQSWYNQCREGGYAAVGKREKGSPRIKKQDEVEYRIKKLTMENKLLKDFLRQLERE